MIGFAFNLVIGPVTFLAPLALLGILALPIIWWILQVTPPQPKQAEFPPLRILQDVMTDEETPDSTPLWLLLFRLFLAALIAIALASPIMGGRADETSRPLTLVIDNGWDAAPSFTTIIRDAEARITKARRENLDVLLLTTAETQTTANFTPASDAMNRLKTLSVSPLPSDRAAAAKALAGVNISASDAVWLSSDIEFGNSAILGKALTAARSVKRYAPLPENRVLLSADVTETANGFRAVYVNPGADSARVIEITAHDRGGSIIARSEARFAPGVKTAEAEFELPADLRNRVTVLRAAGLPSAGAVKLLDDSWGRPVIGILTVGENDSSPLLSEPYYAETALAPYADIFTGTLEELLPVAPSIIIMPDAARTDSQEMIDYVETGGLLIRFAGPKLAARADALLPVPLREGDRALGGALTWEDPQSLDSFPSDSPFFGLRAPEDITVRQQVMAEPGAQTDAFTWARLQDGSPIVTSAPKGLGRIVLFHVTAGPEWSNLAVGGLYVDMLRRLLPLANQAASTGQSSDGSDWAPERVLTGYGRLAAPSISAQTLSDEAFNSTPISAAHPAGLYRQGVRRKARNAVSDPSVISTIGNIAGVNTASYTAPKSQTLGGILLAAALILLAIDVLFSLLSSGRMGYLKPKALSKITAILAAAIFISLPAVEARAQDQAQSVTDALGLHLAYVKTGDSRVDSLSEAAMNTLVKELTTRTTIEPTGARGVTLGVDPLVFYPFIYFPVERDAAELTAEASAAINAYMASGGTVVFDTRDQGDRALLGTSTHPGLSAVTKDLDIPQIGPVPDDHVLTKSFYLLQSFPGRWSNGTVWVDKDRNGTARDGVSSVIIGANDWAAGWAADNDGEFIISLENDMARQREFSIRFGVNVAMYTLSGNYKADQVHAAALVERIGRTQRVPADLGRANEEADE